MMSILSASFFIVKEYEFMKQTKHIYLETIDNFSSNSLYERTMVRIPLHNTVIVPSQGNEICRIIHSTNRTFVSVQEKYIQTISEYLRANDIAKKWANILTVAFEDGEYNHHKYINVYLDEWGMKPKGGRLVDFVQFYIVSIVNGYLDE